MVTLLQNSDKKGTYNFMLRASVVCSAIGSTLAVSVEDRHEKGALIPAWLQDFDVDDDRPRAASVQLDFGLGVQSLSDADARFTNRKGLLLTKEEPMTAEDVKWFVKSLTKGGKDDQDDVDDLHDIELAGYQLDDKGNSVRLGNGIDLWWYELNFPRQQRGVAALGRSGGGMNFSPANWKQEFFATYDFQCKHTKKCFGRYLAEEASKIQWATTSGDPDCCVARYARLRAEQSPKLQHLQAIMTSRYALYQPHTVRDYMLPEMHDDLLRAFQAYATKYDATLLEPPAAEAVVHYRVGDALDNEPPMHPRSIAQALALLSPQPKTIEVLNGGFNFQPHNPASIKFSVWLLKLLSDEILKVMPHAKVTLPTAASIKASSVDQDWAKLVNAKMMVRPIPCVTAQNTTMLLFSRLTVPPLCVCTRLAGGWRRLLRIVCSYSSEPFGPNQADADTSLLAWGVSMQRPSF
jgi:hypothetical protein